MENLTNAMDEWLMGKCLIEFALEI